MRTRADPSEPMKDGIPARAHLFTLVLALWLAGFGLGQFGLEPYPAILQPSFGYVADAGDTVKATEVRYVVAFADGSTQRVEVEDLLTDAGDKAEYIALNVIYGGESDPDVIAWVSDKVARLDLDAEPVKLMVQTVEVTISHDLQQTDRAVPRTLATVVLDR